MENSSHHHKDAGHRKRWRWIVIVIVFILVYWSFKWIWPGHRYDHHRWGGHHWMELSQDELNKRMERSAGWAFKKLDTTDDQEEVILAEMKGLTPFILKLQSERLELMGRFREALEQDPVDQEVMEEILGEVKDLTHWTLERAMESFINIWEALTPEQRKEALEEWEKH